MLFIRIFARSSFVAGLLVVSNVTFGQNSVREPLHATVSPTAAQPSPGAVDPTFEIGTGPDGRVLAVALQPDDKILVGGTFTNFNGVLRPGLVRLLQNGAIDPEFKPRSLNPLNITGMLAQLDGKVVISGFFSTNLNDYVPGAARLNADGSLDDSFQPAAVDSYVLALHNGGFLALSPEGLVRLNRNGTRDANFSVVHPFPGLFGSAAIRNINVQVDGRIVISGFFGSVNGQLGSNPYPGIVRVLPNGELDSSFRPSVGDVLSMITDNGNIRTWTSLGQQGTGRRSIKVLDPSGKLVDEIFTKGVQNPDPSYSSYPVAFQADGKIWAADYDGLGRFHADGTRDVEFQCSLKPWNIFLDLEVTLGFDTDDIVFQNDGRALVKGSFKTVNDAPHANFIRLLVDTAVGPPRIIVPPLDRTVTAGTEIALVAKASSATPVHWQWQRDGVNIPGATNSTLVFLNVSAADTGSYSVIVSNDQWLVTSTAGNLRLAGGEPPGILTQPLNQNVTQGDAAAFNVTATTNALSYQWEFENKSLVGATNSTLVLAPALLANAGQYRVLVANAFGSTTSLVATLTVQRRAPSAGPSYDISFFPGRDINGPVLSVAANDKNEVLISGGFTNVGGQSRFFLARLKPDGSVDPAFRPAREYLPFARMGGDVSWTADGKVLWLVAPSTDDQRPCRRFDARVVRLMPLGEIDPGFGYASADYVQPQPDGSIIFSYSTSGPCTFGYVGRLTASGQEDPGFSIRLNTDMLHLGTPVRPFVQSSGKVIVFGSFNGVNGSGVSPPVRLFPDGRLDASFVLRLGGGQEQLQLYPMVPVLQPDDRILVPTVEYPPNPPYVGDKRIRRLEPDGALDTGFSTKLLFSGSENTVDGLALQSDGKILVWGKFTQISGVPRNRLARLNRDGTLDTGFDPSLPDGGIIYSVAARSDGVIVVGGNALPGGNVLMLYPRELSQPVRSEGQFTARLATLYGKTYQIEFANSPSSTNWTVLETIIGDGTSHSITDSATNPHRFYRVSVRDAE